ncbi:MAG: hypothetical protein AAGA16_12990 [Cyanobacteria bacterium P01_E01_bin.35]
MPSNIKHVEDGDCKDSGDGQAKLFRYPSYHTAKQFNFSFTNNHLAPPSFPLFNN